MMGVVTSIRRYYKKGTIHLIESIISSFILLLMVIYFASNISPHTSMYHHYDVLKEESDIVMGNTTYLFTSRRLGVIRHVTNAESFLFNTSQFTYAYVIHEGHIIKVYPSFNKNYKNQYYSSYRYINSTYVEIFFDCSSSSLCEYDVLLMPRSLENSTLLDIIFYNNETAYVVIE